MSDYSVSEHRMAESLPDMPRYKALCHVLSSRLMLAAFLVALLGDLLSVVSIIVSYQSSFAYYTAMLSDSYGRTAAAADHAIFFAVLAVIVLLMLGIIVLEFLPQWLLISRARHGKLIGRKPFTVLRTCCILLVVGMSINLFFSLILFAALEINILQIISLAMQLVFYGALVRMLGVQRDIAMWGSASRHVSYKATAFIMALQIIPTLAALLLTVLQFVNPAYFKLTAYASTGTLDFVTAVIITLISFLSTALYALTILRAGKEFAAAEPEPMEL